MPPLTSNGPDDVRALAVRWFQEIWNRQREATIDELCSEDLEGYMEGAPGPVGKEEFRAYFHAMTRAISDLRVEVRQTSVDGHKTVVAWHLTGTHTGPGLGVPPSGRPVSIHGLTLFEWKDGQVVRGQDRWNRGEFIQSLMQVPMGELRRRFDLTERQAQVALLMADRRTYKEIARELDIRPNTARRHSSMVLRKLGIHRREDVARVIANGHGTGNGSGPIPDHGSDLKGAPRTRPGLRAGRRSR